MSKPSILIAVLTLVAISTAAHGRLVGGRMRVVDVGSNKEVQELGRFSVDNYNRSNLLRWASIDGAEAAPLRFVKVVKAERQVVAGIKYYLKVEAMQGKERRVFDAQVVVKPWSTTSKQLLSFAPSTKILF